MQLRPYQQNLVTEVYQKWQAGAANVLAVMPTGAGKSVCIGNVTHQHQGLSCVIAHRQELVTQLSLHLGKWGVMHRLIAPKNVIRSIMAEHRAEFGRSFYNPQAPAAVAGVDTLVARSSSLAAWATQVTMWVQDECFTAGTLIDGKPIEKIRSGDYVTAFDERTGEFSSRKVIRTFCKPAPSVLYEIKLSTHHVLYVTSEHPFWTEKGWLNAADIKSGQNLLVDQMFVVRREDRANDRTSEIQISKNWSHILPEQEVRLRSSGLSQGVENTSCYDRQMRSVWCGISDLLVSKESTKERRASVLWQDMLYGTQSRDIIHDNDTNEQEVRICEDEKKQPDDRPNHSGEGVKYSTVDWSQTTRPLREWCGSDQCRTSVDGHAVTYNAIDLESCCQDRFKFTMAATLQNRCGFDGFQHSNRGGWAIASRINSTGVGRTEGCFFDWQRVESVKVLKSDDPSIPGDGFVYNIEVDQQHTYVANGVVVHNCHHVLQNNKWGKAASLFPNARGLGVTATPKRADGRGLGADNDGVFHTMVQGPTMRELIDMGNLTDYRLIAPTSDFDADSIKVTASGDFSPKEMREASRKSHIVGDVVENYLKFAAGESGITFTTDVETAYEMAAQYNAAGVRAEAVSAKTPDATRNDYIRRFKRGEIKQLVNVDLFGEGFDLPSLGVVSMARPTQSLAVFMQQFGRALRPSPETGKLYGKVIDHVGNWKRHGLPDVPRVWSLAPREKRARGMKDDDIIQLTTCVSCFYVYERVKTVCPHCGHRPEPEGRSKPEQVDGDLTMLDPAVLQQMRQAAIDAMESPASVAARSGGGSLGARGNANRQAEKIQSLLALQDTIALWAGKQRHEGRPDQESYRLFYLTFGIDVLSAMALSRADADKLRERIETHVHQDQKVHA